MQLMSEAIPGMAFFFPLFFSLFNYQLFPPMGLIYSSSLLHFSFPFSVRRDTSS